MAFGSILSTLILIGVLALGALPLFRGHRNKANLIFGFFVFSVAFWVFSNLMADISQSHQSLLFWSKLTLVGVILVPLFFWKFSLNFPRATQYKKIYEILIWFAAAAQLIFVPTKYNIVSV